MVPSCSVVSIPVPPLPCAPVEKKKRNRPASAAALVAADLFAPELCQKCLGAALYRVRADCMTTTHPSANNNPKSAGVRGRHGVQVQLRTPSLPADRPSLESATPLTGARTVASTTAARAFAAARAHALVIGSGAPHRPSTLLTSRPSPPPLSESRPPARQPQAEALCRRGLR